jgi:hypothetical protein
VIEEAKRAKQIYASVKLLEEKLEIERLRAERAEAALMELQSQNQNDLEMQNQRLKRKVKLLPNFCNVFAGFYAAIFISSMHWLSLQVVDLQFLSDTIFMKIAVTSDGSHINNTTLLPDDDLLCLFYQALMFVASNSGKLIYFSTYHMYAIKLC